LSTCSEEVAVAEVWWRVHVDLKGHTLNPRVTARTEGGALVRAAVNCHAARHRRGRVPISVVGMEALVALRRSGAHRLRAGWARWGCDHWHG